MSNLDELFARLRRAAAAASPRTIVLVFAEIWRIADPAMRPEIKERASATLADSGFTQEAIDREVALYKRTVH